MRTFGKIVVGYVIYFSSFFSVIYMFIYVMFNGGRKLTLHCLSLVHANKGRVPFCKFNCKWHRTFIVSSQCCGRKDDANFSSLFIPVPVKPNPDDINVGAELTGALNKSDLLKVLNKFYQRKEIKLLALESGLDSKYINHVITFLLLRFYTDINNAISEHCCTVW